MILKIQACFQQQHTLLPADTALIKFRTLMGLQQRARMSENLIRRGSDPFKVVMRKLVCSFRTRIIQSNNVLLETIVGSMHFMHSKLTRKWNAAVLNLRP